MINELIYALRPSLENSLTRRKKTFRPLSVDYINWHNKLIYLYGEFMVEKAFL